MFFSELDAHYRTDGRAVHVAGPLEFDLQPVILVTTVPEQSAAGKQVEVAVIVVVASGRLIRVSHVTDARFIRGLRELPGTVIAEQVSPGASIHGEKEQIEIVIIIAVCQSWRGVGLLAHDSAGLSVFEHIILVQPLIVEDTRLRLTTVR